MQAHGILAIVCKRTCYASNIDTATFPTSNIDVVMGPDKLFDCRVHPWDQQLKRSV
jgi:hypothetical protein